VRIQQAIVNGLYKACSPLTGVLPWITPDLQASLQDHGSQEEFPATYRWIILRGSEPIGRIILDATMTVIASAETSL
jgi:hypothetical protein